MARITAFDKNIQTIGSTVKIDGSMRNSRWVRLLAYVTGSVNRNFCCGTNTSLLRIGF
jgi:hypothetical protein